LLVFRCEPPPNGFGRQLRVPPLGRPHPCRRAVYFLTILTHFPFPSPPSIYIKFNRGRCLTIIGTEGGGKPLKDHLEALDHYDAIRYVREMARERSMPLTESYVGSLHSLVVKRSRPDIAGRYADLPHYVRTETGRHGFPSPAEIPALMGGFAAWLRTTPDSPPTAFTAHRRLVDIHPFNDGNGRTARLLMNLILIRSGYPPIAVRPEDRPDYIRGLQQAQAGGGTASFDRLMYNRLEAALDDYLNVFKEAAPPG
jgi:Fic family protein